MTHDDTFKAATWNVFHGTSVKRLTPLLHDRLADGVTVFLFQEMAQPEHLHMLEQAGLKYFFHPRQYVVAWVPLTKDRQDGWTGTHGKAVRLSGQKYQSQGGDGWQYTDAAAVTLTDAAGRTIDALSYHTPAHVQRSPSKRNPRRYKALRESMKTLAKRGRAAKTDAVLYGGDDNVDEAKAPRLWAFMLKRATGLRQVPAPHATHGGGRRIDDFRIRGLRPLGGSVHDGGGDHKCHVHEFAWHSHRST